MRKKNNCEENNPRNIMFSPPDIGDAEINEVIDALKSGWIILEI